MKDIAIFRDARITSGLGLAVLLAATRFDHFGAIPDASLAVFLVGGLLVGGALPFAALFALAFAVDLAAIEVEAWRAYCMTPAYWGLVPTYAMLWLGGAWLARSDAAFEARRMLPVGALLFSLAFVVSNLTWWASSHRFDMAFGEFWLSVARYYPAYIGSGLLYVAIAALVARAGVPLRHSAG